MPEANKQKSLTAWPERLEPTNVHSHSLLDRLYQWRNQVVTLKPPTRLDTRPLNQVVCLNLVGKFNNNNKLFKIKKSAMKWLSQKAVSSGRLLLACLFLKPQLESACRNYDDRKLVKMKLLEPNSEWRSLPVRPAAWQRVNWLLHTVRTVSVQCRIDFNSYTHSHAYTPINTHTHTRARVPIISVKHEIWCKPPCTMFTWRGRRILDIKFPNIIIPAARGKTGIIDRLVTT